VSTIDYESLIETRRSLVDVVSPLSFTEFTWKPDAQSWSIAQVCHHLYIVEKLFAGAIQYGLNQSKVKKVESKSLDMLTDRSIKIKAPETSIPSDEPFEVQQILKLLVESREMFYKVLNNIEDPSVLSEKSVKHPVFGELPLIQWVELLPIHEQRHIEQIKEIKAKMQ
jgi:hypothetical protein